MPAQTFTYSICKPLEPAVIEMGAIDASDILETFESFPWRDYLNQMKGKDDSEIFFSPSLAFENTANKHGVDISIVGDANNYEFYIYYKRPANISRFFGLIKYHKEQHLSDITGQTKKDAEDILKALIRNDEVFLEKKFGK